MHNLYRKSYQTLTLKSLLFLLKFHKYLASSSPSKPTTASASPESNRTRVRQIGQADTFTSHVSKHRLWNTWLHAASFLHHCPSRNASRQTTQSVCGGEDDVVSDWGWALKRNWGRALRCLEENPDEGRGDWARRRCRAPAARKRKRTMAARPTKRKKREVMEVITRTLMMRERSFGLDFGGGGCGCAIT